MTLCTTNFTICIEQSLNMTHIHTSVGDWNVHRRSPSLYNDLHHFFSYLPNTYTRIYKNTTHNVYRMTYHCHVLSSILQKQLKRSNSFKLYLLWSFRFTSTIHTIGFMIRSCVLQNSNIVIIQVPLNRFRELVEHG